ncbi:hypothetical protein [Virgibacillus sp. SK37]|uniref:hypothetical protein n=1 Tax=Virgibacillus sp. SK37 TaxID=403957 RepID=UPI0004D0DD41|nr:hypothetical protein [Virgibacillus sp. SK37]AIF45055.1 hypothetical protein X953_00860 [Virgibacillus sp. SK37]
MLDFISYILPILILLVGLLILLVGKAKKNIKLIGVGIGFIMCLVVLEAPNFIQGFIQGFAEGVN